MADATASDPVVREIQIDATPETVFEFFTDPDKITRWLATDATLDPRPGGVCHQTHAGGGEMGSGPYFLRGEFVEVTPPTRVVFTWGFTNPDVGLPPGSTVVEVTLVPRDGGTHLRLVHSGLPAALVGEHSDGWEEMLARLADAVATTPADRR